MVRRNYRNNLNFIETGFKACWHNTQDLVKGEKVLLDNSLRPLALSTSVLALEQLGFFAVRARRQVWFFSFGVCV